MKAADVDTTQLLAFIDATNVEHHRGTDRERGDEYLAAVERMRGVRWCMGVCCSWHVKAAYPDVPWKVMHAKIERLIRRGYIDGCGCGCRGDWQLTSKGREAISPAIEVIR